MNGPVEDCRWRQAALAYRAAASGGWWHPITRTNQAMALGFIKSFLKATAVQVVALAFFGLVLWLQPSHPLLSVVLMVGGISCACAWVAR